MTENLRTEMYPEVNCLRHWVTHVAFQNQDSGNTVSICLKVS